MSHSRRWWETGRFSLEHRIWEPCLTWHRKLLSHCGETYCMKHDNISKWRGHTQSHSQCDRALRGTFSSYRSETNSSYRAEDSTAWWRTGRSATMELVCHQCEPSLRGEWVLEYHKCFWLHVSINMEREREGKVPEKLCKSLYHSSQINLRELWWEDAHSSTGRHLLMDSATTDIMTRL